MSEQPTSEEWRQINAETRRQYQEEYPADHIWTETWCGNGGYSPLADPECLCVRCCSPGGPWSRTLGAPPRQLQRLRDNRPAWARCEFSDRQIDRALNHIANFGYVVRAISREENTHRWVLAVERRS